MRVVALVLCAGCSFVYNPDHLSGSSDGNNADVEVVADVDRMMR